MSAADIKCEECGNDGTTGSLYLTVDAKWRDGEWILEEREDEGGGELDCLECDHRTEAPEGIFPYGMTFKLGNLAAIITHDPRDHGLTARDWTDIQEAVSNSDLPNERRIRLLDKIGTLCA